VVAGYGGAQAVARLLGIGLNRKAVVGIVISDPSSATKQNAMLSFWKKQNQENRSIFGSKEV
jgi:hypothetical protein